MSSAEETLVHLVGWLRLTIEATGALIIGVGAAVTTYATLRERIVARVAVYQQTRHRLGQFLVLGLEFQLASDILGTAVAPSWEQIGKLAAIAAIRTFLNFFLLREQREVALAHDRPEGSA